MQLLVAGTLFAQTNEKWMPVSKEETRKMFQNMSNAYFSTPSFSMQVNQTSYVGHSSEVPHDKSTGKFLKNNNTYTSLLLGIRTIQNEKLKVVIDSADKLIAVSNSDRAFKSVPLTEDLDQSLFFVLDIKKMTANDLVYYSLRFKENFTYTKIDFILTPDFFMKEMVMYFDEDLPVNADDAEHSPKSKLKYKVSYSGIKKNIALNTAQFSENRYLTYNSKQKTYALKEEYKNYTLQDLRITKD